jgi:hypothetical protein
MSEKLIEWERLESMLWMELNDRIVKECGIGIIKAALKAG